MFLLVYRRKVVVYSKRFTIEFPYARLIFQTWIFSNHNFFSLRKWTSQILQKMGENERKFRSERKIKVQIPCISSYSYRTNSNQGSMVNSPIWLGMLMNSSFLMNRGGYDPYKITWKLKFENSSPLFVEFSDDDVKLDHFQIANHRVTVEHFSTCQNVR